MKPNLLQRLLFGCIIAFGIYVYSVQAATMTTPQTKAAIQADYGRLPMHFEPNQGQIAEQVKFLARGQGYVLFVTEQELVLSLRQNHRDSKNTDRSEVMQHPFSEHLSTKSTDNDSSAKNIVLRLRFDETNPALNISGIEPLGGYSNYFLGNDPSQWHTQVPHYRKVKLEAVYPGIDLVLYGNPQQLEYDFVVAPGADPGQIQLSLSGAEAVRINDQGDLVLSVAGGEFVQKTPVVYQEIDGQRQLIAGRYQLLDEVTSKLTFAPEQPIALGFQLAAYDPTKPLVIDPIVMYSTYLGGHYQDYGYDIAVDSAGNAYVTGRTDASDFPTVNPLYDFKGGYDDAFIVKLNASGSALVYATYLGGYKKDIGQSIAVDSAGNAYVTGWTESYDFPTVNALYSDLGASDAFIVKLNASGSAVVYATYLGGSDSDSGYGIAADSAGNAYVTGHTYSSDFPTVNAAYSNYRGDGDAFIAKFNATGSALAYATYLGGRGYDYGYGVAVDSASNAYVTGKTDYSDFPTVNPLYPNHGGYYDAFIAKLNATGSAFVYATYLGGSSNDIGNDIAVDSAGNAYVTGVTESSNFPTVNALYPSYGGGEGDAFIFKLHASGNAAVYSTYLGNRSADYTPREEHGDSIAVDSVGNVHVTGRTESRYFPTVNAIYSAYQGGTGDAFVAKLHASGQSAVYSTYLGGSDSESGWGIAVDSAGNAYVTGYTWSTNFPAVNALYPHSAFAPDVFITKIAQSEYTLEVNRNGTGTGLVTSKPTGIQCGDDCTEDYLVTTEVQLTATADADSIFLGWSGDCSGTTLACTVQMSNQRIVVATFNQVSADCSGDEVSIENRTFDSGKSTTCVGETSITGSDLSIPSNAEVIFDAPITTLQSETHIHQGATFHIISHQ